MSQIHVVGFGDRPKHNFGNRLEWYPKFPEKKLEFQSEDAVILNLNEVHTIEAIQKLQTVVENFKQNGGILIVVSAPIKWMSNNISNYHFLARSFRSTLLRYHQ